MGKGNKFAPSRESHGNWFCHLGMPLTMSSRLSGTTTGTMLSSTMVDSSSHIKCPPLFQNKVKRSYQEENPFSAHDNRNSFQNHGVYFDQGLGKMKEHEKSQHRSKDVVRWISNDEMLDRSDVNSIYREDFPAKNVENFQHCRRYSKVYPVPNPSAFNTPSTVTMWVSNDEIVPRTFMQTLADAQEPYLKHNPWRYSYNARSFARSSPKKRLKVP